MRDRNIEDGWGWQRIYFVQLCSGNFSYVEFIFPFWRTFQNI